MTDLSWNKNARLYEAYFLDEPIRISSDVVFPQIIRSLGRVRNKKILDYGCGQGRFSYKFADLGATVTAYDKSQEQLKKARSLNKNDNIRFVSQKTKIDGNFDITLCFMVLLCNKKKSVDSLVDDIYKFTKPGGLCIFVNTWVESLGEKFNDFYSIKPRRIAEGCGYKTIIPTSLGNIVVKDYYYSQEFLQKLFEKHGFEILKQEVVSNQFLIQVVKKSDR